jgi:hypothetical protein
VYSQSNVQIKEEASDGQSSDSPLPPILTQAPVPASSPSENVVFLNSEQGECFMSEEPEAADSDSNVDDQDAGYVDFSLSSFITYFNDQL